MAASMLVSQVNKNDVDKERMQRAFYKLVDNFKLIKGTSIFFESNACDGKDSEYRSSNYGSKGSGRISWYLYLENGKAVYLPQADVSYEAANDTGIIITNAMDKSWLGVRITNDAGTGNVSDLI